MISKSRKHLSPEKYGIGKPNPNACAVAAERTADMFTTMHPDEMGTSCQGKLLKMPCRTLTGSQPMADRLSCACLLVASESSGKPRLYCWETWGLCASSSTGTQRGGPDAAFCRCKQLMSHH